MAAASPARPSASCADSATEPLMNSKFQPWPTTNAEVRVCVFARATDWLAARSSVVSSAGLRRESRRKCAPADAKRCEVHGERAD
jgi:hypothetical protein